MKTKRFWQGMLLLVLGMAVAGCDNSTSPTNNNNSNEVILIGTWVTSGGLEYKFNTDGTFEASQPGQDTMFGTFSVSGNNLTLNSDGELAFTGTFFLEGNTLTMTFGGESMVFTRVN